MVKQWTFMDGKSGESMSDHAIGYLKPTTEGRLKASTGSNGKAESARLERQQPEVAALVNRQRHFRAP